MTEAETIQLTKAEREKIADAIMVKLAETVQAAEEEAENSEAVEPSLTLKLFKMFRDRSFNRKRTIWSGEEGEYRAEVWAERGEGAIGLLLCFRSSEGEFVLPETLVDEMIREYEDGKYSECVRALVYRDQRGDLIFVDADQMT